MSDMAEPADVHIRRATPTTATDLTLLADEATRHGIRNVATLRSDWASGAQRFDGVGERLLLAWSEGRVVGVGGLTRCPHVAGAHRVRRFYVAAAARRRGVAKALAEELLAVGFEHTGTITCNARASAAAAPFWESLGFEPVDIDGITHVLRRS